MKIAVVGATSYTSIELIRLLAAHPGGIELEALTSRTEAGRSIVSFAPNLRGYCDLTLEKTAVETLQGRVDAAVLAVPHRAAMEYVPALLKESVRVLDFSADYRLKDAETYESWYAAEHTSPELLSSAVYGLPELYRQKIAGADLVANPGCYPTSAVFALLPAVEERIIDDSAIVIDSKSGLSGAGRKLNEKTLFSARQENVAAYGIASHRHTPEMEQELQAAAGNPDLRVGFTPHYMPMTRGILTAAYAPLTRPIALDELHAVYERRYADEPFIQTLPPGESAETKAVYGSNNVHVGVAVDERVNRLIVTCALDNLGKGAAGAALQNLNLMAGLDETAGLRFPGVMP
ncbi:MAG: N-acetyl-gamma-glutamyl-phosphate reductase [Candidatus Poribacteria bacterium]|nr:N-acetyl-gamma-glutamyl-phosphate reductase [Candidatus Poribacteria bacterium]